MMSTSAGQGSTNSVVPDNAQPLPADEPADAPAAAPQSVRVRKAVAKLKPPMQRAFTMMIDGVAITTIAQTLDVTRATIYYWKNFNPRFRAALNT